MENNSNKDLSLRAYSLNSTLIEYRELFLRMAFNEESEKTIQRKDIFNIKVIDLEDNIGYDYLLEFPTGKEVTIHIPNDSADIFVDYFVGTNIIFENTIPGAVKENLKEKLANNKLLSLNTVLTKMVSIYKSEEFSFEKHDINDVVMTILLWGLTPWEPNEDGEVGYEIDNNSLTIEQMSQMFNPNKKPHSLFIGKVKVRRLNENKKYTKTFNLNITFECGTKTKLESVDFELAKRIITGTKLLISNSGEFLILA